MNPHRIPASRRIASSAGIPPPAGPPLGIAAATPFKPDVFHRPVLQVECYTAGTDPTGSIGIGHLQSGPFGRIWARHSRLSSLQTKTGATSRVFPLFLILKRQQGLDAFVWRCGAAERPGRGCIHTVEVGPSRRQQAVLRCEGGQPGRIGLALIRVPDLNPVQAQPGKLLQQLLVAVRDRMGEHRDPPPRCG